MTSKASRVLPTLALILSILPTVLSLAIIAFAANGNWAFLILGGHYLPRLPAPRRHRIGGHERHLPPSEMGQRPRHHRRDPVLLGVVHDP